MPVCVRVCIYRVICVVFRALSSLHHFLCRGRQPLKPLCGCLCTCSPTSCCSSAPCKRARGKKTGVRAVRTELLGLIGGTWQNLSLTHSLCFSGVSLLLTSLSHVSLSHDFSLVSLSLASLTHVSLRKPCCVELFDLGTLGTPARAVPHGLSHSSQNDTAASKAAWPRRVITPSARTTLSCTISPTLRSWRRSTRRGCCSAYGAGCSGCAPLPSPAPPCLDALRTIHSDAQPVARADRSLPFWCR